MTREEIWNKAFKRISELYGEYPGLKIVNRFLSEKAALSYFGVAEYFDELAGICKESLDKYNEKLVVKNTVASCFTAYLLGASEINPLPAHYYCEVCKRVEWADEADCIFDMRATRTCECGAEMRIDGYDIPEMYLAYAKRLKTKDPVPENYKDLFESLTKKHFQWSLLGAAQAVNLLGQATGVAPDEIDLSDREIKYRLLLLGGDFSCMNPKLAEFLKQAYAVVPPCSYAEVLKLIGLAKGIGTWEHNARDLLMEGKCRRADIPATRDEVFMMIRDAMQEQGVYDTGFAYDVAEKARKGYYAEHGMDGYTIDTLKSLGFGDWFASYLLGVRYVSTKALSVMELHYIILLTWYQTYYPKHYECVMNKGTVAWKNAE